MPTPVYALNLFNIREAAAGESNDPALADLHPHRENGTGGCIWHLFDKLDDLRPLLK